MNPLIVGIAAGILTSISLLPQLIKIIKEKKANDISVFMLIILLSGLCAWVWYGILKEDLPVIVTNSFSMLVNLLVIIFTIRYKNN
jgi:MtN3 and saliva related transmembrane protein